MNRLEEIRKSLGLKGPEAARAMGIKYTTYRSYEKGERQMDSEQLIKIADFYNVSIDYLLCRDAKAKQTKMPLVQKYEKLDEHGKKVIDLLLEAEAERICEEPVQIQPVPQKVIPLFPAAAGPGEPLDGIAVDECQVDADSKAVLAVRISGDSMEPYFHSGDIVYVESRHPKLGDIAVVSVNGYLIVKQFIPSYNGIFYLRSLNRKRANLDYTYLPSSSDQCIAWGTVIHEKIPVVD